MSIQFNKNTAQYFTAFDYFFSSNRISLCILLLFFSYSLVTIWQKHHFNFTKCCRLALIYLKSIKNQSFVIKLTDYMVQLTLCKKNTGPIISTQFFSLYYLNFVSTINFSSLVTRGTYKFSRLQVNIGQNCGQKIINIIRRYRTYTLWLYVMLWLVPLLFYAFDSY